MAKKTKKRANGEGSIYQRSNGTWVAQITIGRDSEGRPKRTSFSGKTRKEVQEKVNKALSELQTGTFIEPTKTTLAQWLDTWMEEYKKPSLRPTTYEGYNFIIKTHITPATIGNIQLRHIQPSDLQRFYNAKLESGRADGKGGLSPRMIRYIHAILHGALKQAVREGLVIRNVTEAVTLPRHQRKEFTPLTQEQVIKFLNSIKNDKFYPAILLDLGSGLRLGELLALRWQDVDLKNAVIRVRQSLASVKGQWLFQEPKSEKSRRSIPIPKDIITELKAHKARQNQEKLLAGTAYQDHDLVFAMPDGNPLKVRSFQEHFEKLLSNAGMPRVRFHDLRHTYATLLLEAGEHPKVVQELLGHSQITMTLDTYSHVLPELKQAAAAKLGNILQKRKSPSQVGGK